MPSNRNFNRFPPTFEEKLINQHYASHRHRIEEAKSKMDTSSGRFAVSKTKPNKIGVFDLKLERENRVLRNRIQQVLNGRRDKQEVKRNNNNHNQNLDQIRTSTDTSRILHRLKTRRSHYPRGQYLADFQKKEKLLDGISRFPNAWRRTLDSSPTTPMVPPTVLPPIGQKPRPLWGHGMIPKIPWMIHDEKYKF